MTQKVFLNDGIVDSSQAVIGYNDAGFLYGAGLFETMRSANGVVFALDDHLERLFNSAGKLGVRLAGDKEFFADAVYQTLNANELSDARLRLTVTSGPMNIDEDAKPTTVITAANFEPYPKDYYQKGVMVVLSPCRQNPADGLCAVSYTHLTLPTNREV